MKEIVERIMSIGYHSKSEIFFNEALIQFLIFLYSCSSYIIYIMH